MRRKFIAVPTIALLAVAAVALALAALWTGSGESQAQDPPTNIDGASGHSLIPVVDSDWVTGSGTSDCAPNYTGWGDDQWQLTLTSPRDVAISVDDCCCPGDFYEVYLDGTLVGTTPDLSPPWGCDYSGPLSTDTFTCSLPAGTYLITVRDAGFDGHTPAEITAQAMCPAGYTVSGALSAYTGRHLCGPRFVGGVVDINVESSAALAGSADGGSAGSSVPYTVVLAGAAAAAAVAITGGAVYARRRWLR